MANSRRTIAFLLCGASLLAAGILMWRSARRPQETGLRFLMDPAGLAGKLMEDMAAEYERETGVHITLTPLPFDSSGKLTQVEQYLGARESKVDVIQLDVIWTGMLAERLEDLGPVLGAESAEFFPAIIENNTVGDRLVAVPFFMDAGMLYYRTDLLEQNGWKAPPDNWQELEEMAASIQESERAAGRPDFHGYLWSGLAREPLTCTALEWFSSEDAGTFVEPDGTVSVNNPNALRALERARGWVGSITPASIAVSNDSDNLPLFEKGDALFMRNWCYAHAVLSQEDSAVSGRFGVAPMPGGEAGHRSALGGWQLGVSRASKNKEEAIRFVLWLTSEKNQLRRAVEGGFPPTRPRVYTLPGLAEKEPHLVAMLPVFESATPRPSRVAGRKYHELSILTAAQLHRALFEGADAAQALADLEKQYKELLQ